MGTIARPGIASFLEAKRFFHLRTDYRYGTTFGFQRGRSCLLTTGTSAAFSNFGGAVYTLTFEFGGCSMMKRKTLVKRQPRRHRIKQLTKYISASPLKALRSED